METLNLLLNSSSKASVEQAVALIFASRHQPINISESPSHSKPLQKLRELLSLGPEISDPQVIQLRYAVLECIKVPLSTGNIEDLAVFFQDQCDKVNPKLKQLLGQIISNQLETWREVSSLQRISLARLQDFDWSLHFQKASNDIPDMQIPAIQMSLLLENTPSTVLSLPTTQQIEFEMTRETLETMIDGLGKIRDQLSSMK